MRPENPEPDFAELERVTKGESDQLRPISMLLRSIGGKPGLVSELVEAVNNLV